MLLRQHAAPNGQDLPGAATPTAASDSSPAAPPTGGPSAAQFASDTLASLLTAQEAPPSSADIASKIIGAVDTNADSTLSLDEVEKALGADTTSGADALGKAFASVDANGDGQIGADELTTALDAKNGARGPDGVHHGRHAHHAHGNLGESTNLADRLLGSADSDGDGALSAGEIETALGSSSATEAFTTAFGKLDTDGDGKLSGTELSAAIDAFRAAHHRGSHTASQTQPEPPTTA